MVETVQQYSIIDECEWTLLLDTVFHRGLCHRWWICLLLFGNGTFERFNCFIGIFFIKPGLAPILAALLIGDKIAMTTIVGIVIIIAGSIVTFMGNKRRETGGPMKEKLN